jgi:hypothetical protein
MPSRRKGEEQQSRIEEERQERIEIRQLLEEDHIREEREERHDLEREERDRQEGRRGESATLVVDVAASSEEKKSSRGRVPCYAVKKKILKNTKRKAAAPAKVAAAAEMVGFEED